MEYKLHLEGKIGPEGTTKKASPTLEDITEIITQARDHLEEIADKDQNAGTYRDELDEAITLLYNTIALLTGEIEKEKKQK